MTKTEREELKQMICGDALYHASCRGGRLIYDGNIFRCSSMDCCYRVTPKTGKLTTRYYYGYSRYEGGNGKGMDELKKSIAQKRIKLLKETPEFAAMKLIRSGDRFWIDVDGERVNPRHFSRHWWMFKWEYEDR